MSDRVCSAAAVARPWVGARSADMRAARVALALGAQRAEATDTASASEKPCNSVSSYRSSEVGGCRAGRLGIENGAAEATWCGVTAH
jgi:hypothetical protein